MVPPVDRVAFTIFGIDIMWYAVLITISIAIAVFLVEKEAKRRGINPDHMSNTLILGIMLGILGARIYYVIFEWDYYSQNLNQILNFRQGGLAIYGGIIVGAITVLAYCKIKKYRPLVALDIIVPALALAQTIGRWGNFINQEAYGYETDFPIAVNIKGVMHHATFLYESVGNFLIFLILTYFTRKKQKYNGQVLGLYLVLYGTIRFFIEGLRMDSLYLGPIRISQLVSILAIIIGILVLVFGRRENNKISHKNA